jgi:integrase
MEVVMLEQYFLRPTTVDRIRSNWLGPQIEQYVEWMHAQKYAQRNITRRVALLCHFADFARANGATDLTSASSLVEKFGDHWMAGNRSWNVETRPKLRRDMCSIIRQMLLLILEGRVTRERGHPPFQFQSEAPGFFKYLLEERGMKKLTVARYVRELNRLAGYLKRVGVTSLSELSPQLLSSFVVETAPKFAPNTRRDLCGVIRTFLRYLHRERILAEDLSVTFEVPKLFRLSNVPRSITWGEVRQVLKVVDRRTVRGRRDYAILIMLVTYGLRACEVAKLTLDDIDWKHERLQIPDRKVGNCTAYPLAGGRGGGINQLSQERAPRNCGQTDLSSRHRSSGPPWSWRCGRIRSALPSKGWDQGTSSGVPHASPHVRTKVDRRRIPAKNHWRLRRTPSLSVNRGVYESRD